MDGDRSHEDPMQNGSDSEWEYEYHPTETETYYVTVDLTSLTNQTLNDFKAAQVTSNSAQKSSLEQVAETPGTGSQADAEEGSAAPGKSSKTVQVLNLDTTNPLVYHDGQIYSCNWSDTIGTDLLLASSDTKLPFEPLHKTSTYQIAAKSTIRLVGAASRLVEKAPDAVAQPDGLVSASPIEQPGTSSPAVPVSVAGSAAPTFQIPIPPTARPERKAQAAFLSRLVQLKARRGEFDHVFLNKGRDYADCDSDSPALWDRGNGVVPWNPNVPRPARKAKKRPPPNGKAADIATGSAEGETNAGDEDRSEEDRSELPSPKKRVSTQAAKGRQVKKVASAASSRIPEPMADQSGGPKSGKTKMKSKLEGQALAGKGKGKAVSQQVRFAPLKFVFEEPGNEKPLGETTSKKKLIKKAPTKQRSDTQPVAEENDEQEDDVGMQDVD